MIRSNSLKAALAQNLPQYGLWCSLASNITAEIVAGAGFDWLLIDVEHSPNDLRSVLAQLQAVAPYDCEAIVRLPGLDAGLIKQYLDIGARSLLLPNVESADSARALVAATRYPPHGVRGVSVAQRANRYGRVSGYHQEADRQIAIVVQIESPAGVRAAADIAQVPGVDAIFVGPSDLAASMGFLGNSRHPDVQEAIGRVREAAAAVGRSTGILAPDEEDARRYMAMGYNMIGVGSDQGLLVKSSDALARSYKSSSVAAS